MGRRKDRARTPGLWIATNELPRTGGHPFDQRLNQVLDAHAFDAFVTQCASISRTVERWFATLTEKQIKRGAHRSTRALETAIREYLTISNGSAKPFVWTKTADEILAKVAGFCQRISNSGH